jgi:hypothetical protein
MNPYQRIYDLLSEEKWSADPASAAAADRAKLKQKKDMEK